MRSLVRTGKHAGPLWPAERLIYESNAFTRSGVIGSSRSRRPVA